METPGWWDGLTSVHEALAAADRADVEHWRALSGDTVGASGYEAPPLTLRLATLGAQYARHADDFTDDQTRRLFALLESVLAAEGAEADAVAAGFFEALLNAWDNGFDLARTWPSVGPESRAYCLAWNDFTGVRTPAWMRPRPTRARRLLTALRRA
ncbi:hypothetical protein [Kitasatospora sp. NPDC004531]